MAELITMTSTIILILVIATVVRVRIAQDFATTSILTISTYGW